MLSICVTIKNRSRVKTDSGNLLLFPNCINSVAQALSLTSDVEIVVADWGSTDWPIHEWIEDEIPHVPIHIVNIECEKFSAGAGRNIAAGNSSGDHLFFMDADMIVNKEAIDYGIEMCEAGNVYYPTVKYEMDGGKQIIHEGGGNVFLPKDVFIKSGKWPEYWVHGVEDTDFHKQLDGIAPITTNNTISIFHQWHPQTSVFKNRHASDDPKDSAVVDNRKVHYTDKINVNTLNVVESIEKKILTNPNTTHSTLNPPARL